LKLKSKEFNQFLKSLSKISDTSILEIKSDEIYSIAASDDRSMFLWSVMKGDFDVETTLNLPSLTKLSKLLDMVGSPDISFTLNHNNLDYKSKIAKFTYHLYEDGILTKPKITLAKIKALKFDYEFEIKKSFIKSLLTNSSIFKDTNKLYVYTEDDCLIWSLADRTMKNTDTLTIIGDPVDFEMDEFIMNLDNVRLIDFGESDIAKFEISKNGIGKITIDSNTIQNCYIISSLTK
jgi:hypothetical protein